MGRPCKCRYCQTSLTTDTAYRIESKNKKAYFCNQDHYEEYIKQEEENAVKKVKAEELENKFYNLMCDILGVGAITNTALWREKKELKKTYSEELIISCLEENKAWLTTSVSKLDGGIYGKIRYVSVILRNKLGDYKTQTSTRTEIIPKMQDEHYETKFKLKKRVGLEDLEDDCDE